MKQAEFKALMEHLEHQLKGFKITFKMYKEQYNFKDVNRTQTVEVSRTNKLIYIKVFDLIKDEKGVLINAILSKDGAYHCTNTQLNVILEILESEVYTNKG